MAVHPNFGSQLVTIAVAFVWIVNIDFIVAHELIIIYKRYPADTSRYT